MTLTSNSACTKTQTNFMVSQSLLAWIMDTQGGLSLEGLVQYLRVWYSLEMGTTGSMREVEPSLPGLLIGPSSIVPYHSWKHLWKSWAPPECKVFLCLAIHKCWTVDWLAKWGLAHPEQCVLCDQEETGQHILTR
jgi:hypothetical protein